MEQELGSREGIAEDLGYMTDSVRRLVAQSGFFGMKILQFGFDGDYANEYLPHRYGAATVAYPGTHDNPTLQGWLATLSDSEWETLREYLWDFHTPGDQIADVLLALLMRSPSRLCIVPLQDYLGLGDEARINRPATVGGNWSWRVGREALNGDLSHKIRRLCALGGRL